MSPLEPAPRDPSVEELRAVAAHAGGRAALYRRKVLLGRGEPRRLAELERAADGATRRAERAGELEMLRMTSPTSPGSRGTD